MSLIKRHESEYIRERRNGRKQVCVGKKTYFVGYDEFVVTAMFDSSFLFGPDEMYDVTAATSTTRIWKI